MPTVRTFRPDATTRLEAAAGGPLGPLIALLACGGGFAVAWWVLDAQHWWLASDPFEMAFGGLLLLALGFGVAMAATRLAGSLLGRRPRAKATLTLRNVPAAGGAVRAELRLSWRMLPGESAVAVLECLVMEDGPDGWASAPSYYWWWDEGRADRKVVWRLTVTIEPGGRPLNFLLSVAPRSGTPATITDNLDTGDMPSGGLQPSYSRIVVRDGSPGVTEFRFPLSRGTSTLASWVAVTAPLWIALPWLAWRDGGDLPWSLAAMLGVAAAVNGVPLLFLMQPRRLVVGPSGILFHRWLLRPRRMHVRDARGAEARTMPVAGCRPLYVWLRHVSNEAVPIGQCRSVQEARWLASAVDEALRTAQQRRSAEMGASQA